MRVLIGCEYSGRARDAFAALGHDAWSCDLLPTEAPGNHFQCDLREVMNGDWDMGIFHPDCTYLTNSAAWAFKDPDFDRYPGVGYHQKVRPGTKTGAERRAAREEALAFVASLMALPYPTAIENPRGFIGTMLRPATQTIQPYDFGDDASKATCLWLSGLMPLRPTQRVTGRSVEWPRGSGKMVQRWANQTDSGQNRLTPSDDRGKDRAKTFPGIAAAFARQWGGRRR